VTSTCIATLIRSLIPAYSPSLVQRFETKPPTLFGRITSGDFAAAALVAIRCPCVDHVALQPFAAGLPQRGTQHYKKPHPAGTRSKRMGCGPASTQRPRRSWEPQLGIAILLRALGCPGSFVLHSSAHARTNRDQRQIERIPTLAQGRAAHASPTSTWRHHSLRLRILAVALQPRAAHELAGLNIPPPTLPRRPLTYPHPADRPNSRADRRHDRPWNGEDPLERPQVVVVHCTVKLHIALAWRSRTRWCFARHFCTIASCTVDLRP